MIAAAIGPVATLLSDVVKRAFPDKTEAAKIEAQLQMALLQADLSGISGQLEINKAEAMSGSFFASSWRPLIGHTCAAAFAWSYVAQPLFSFFASLYLGHTPPLPPTLDMASMMPVLLGILGLGGMRTYEKGQKR